jgi:hypothetical protein
VNNGVVTVMEDVAKQAAKDAGYGADEDKVIPLPIISATVTPGNVAAVAFQVKGSDLMASSAPGVKLMKVFPPPKEAKLFTYVGQAINFADGTFTIMTMSDVILTGPIWPEGDYKLVVFIGDGGDFDLSTVPGTVIGRRWRRRRREIFWQTATLVER